MDPKFKAFAIYEHCLPFNVARAYDEARGIAHPRIDTVSLGSRSICQAKHSLETWDRFGIAARMVEKGITWEQGEVYLRDSAIYRFNLQAEPGHKFPAFVNLQQYYVEEYLYERCRA